MAYDGAVDGVKILHGIAVETGPLAGAAGEPITTAEPRPIRSHQRQDDLDVEPVIQQAIRVIGSREEAMRWLGTPVRALGFATPISCLHDQPGREQVLSVLTNLEHGVL